jgi:hypothetical protein
MTNGYGLHKKKSKRRARKVGAREAAKKTKRKAGKKKTAKRKTKRAKKGPSAPMAM